MCAVEPFYLFNLNHLLLSSVYSLISLRCVFFFYLYAFDFCFTGKSMKMNFIFFREKNLKVNEEKVFNHFVFLNWKPFSCLFYKHRWQIVCLLFVSSSCLLFKWWATSGCCYYFVFKFFFYSCCYCCCWLLA